MGHYPRMQSEVETERREKEKERWENIKRERQEDNTVPKWTESQSLRKRTINVNKPRIEVTME